MRTFVDKVFKDADGTELHYLEIIGDSTEVSKLPTENIVDGSNFLASDSAEVWFFNERSGAWIGA